MSKPTLLVLAAGIGSRYGGLKQIEPVGPSGETIIDYSVYDAVRAGFGKLVFVIRRDIEQAFRETIGARFESRLAVDYVFQELDDLPHPFTPPADRSKPWGTGHAVLAARNAIREPFAVINGDDFYGVNSLRMLATHLTSDTADLAMVGFTLKNTLSEFGSVARGVCRTDSKGYLESVVELTRIQRDGSSIIYLDAANSRHELSGSEIVSLNTWGFTPAVFGRFEGEFKEFLQNRRHEAKSEFFIPTVVNDLIKRNEVRVKVLPTPDSWFGVTYKEDKPRVVASIGQLIAAGIYPPKLWA